jgi:hypothetical protein
MADVKNIIVGAAQIFISTGTGANRPITTTDGLGFTASTSARTKLLSSSSWRDVGYTNAGLEVSYEPGYNDVMVDQLLDAARLFKSTIKVMLKTELTEGTLQNINLVFGQPEQIVAYSGSTASTFNTVTGTYTGSTGATGSAVLSISGGALGDAPVERSLVAVGNAPSGISISASSNAGDVAVAAGSRTERVYVARRVVQIEASSHGLKRDSATVFPVQFRCLPDDDNKYDGAEYGLIIDRVLGTTAN